ncbi:ABC transporter substrate-binding protein [Sulfuriflexus mobilis]|uniref:ABC transporter substrate-binding protein n=1 Tax=Sulfuriflexus mobilis TaxID=1811807 RepID=UPI0015591531|nr:ABC transporter substrate-binding protein [Sulfuriflexus mobilis]
MFRIATVLVVFLVYGCTDSEVSTNLAGKTRIAVSKTPLSAPLYIAEAKGFFRKHGVNVEMIELVGGHRSMQAVLTGKADMGTSSDYPVMINSFTRDDFAVLASFVSSENDVKLMANRKNAIHVARDLKGKTIGIVKGGSSHYFLDRYLLFNGMQLKDVTTIHINPEEMPAALQAGKVDALSVWEPYGYLAHKRLGSDLNILLEISPYRETFNLITGKNYTKNHPEAASRVLRALKDSVEFMAKEPAQAQEIVVKRLGLDSEFIDWVWKDYQFLLTLDQALIVTLENEARWAVENNIVSASGLPNYLDYILPGPLKGVDASAVTLIN